MTNKTTDPSQKWGVYGGPFSGGRRYYIRVNQIVPGMWFANNPDDIPFLANRRLCRSVTDDSLTYDCYHCGKLIQHAQGGKIQGDEMTRLVEFMLYEQPYGCVKQLVETFGPFSEWEKWQDDLIQSAKAM